MSLAERLNPGDAYRNDIALRAKKQKG